MFDTDYIVDMIQNMLKACNIDTKKTWQRTDHRGVPCAKLRCNTSSQYESQSWRRSDPYLKQAGDRQLVALLASRVAASVLLRLVSTYSPELILIRDQRSVSRRLAPSSSVSSYHLRRISSMFFVRRDDHDTFDILL